MSLVITQSSAKRLKLTALVLGKVRGSIGGRTFKPVSSDISSNGTLVNDFYNLAVISKVVFDTIHSFIFA